eukprot:364698-Chlamydomonas_euryale.AAC.3
MSLSMFAECIVVRTQPSYACLADGGTTHFYVEALNTTSLTKDRVPQQRQQIGIYKDDKNGMHKDDKNGMKKARNAAAAALNAPWHYAVHLRRQSTSRTTRSPGPGSGWCRRACSIPAAPTPVRSAPSSSRPTAPRASCCCLVAPTAAWRWRTQCGIRRLRRAWRACSARCARVCGTPPGSTRARSGAATFARRGRSAAPRSLAATWSTWSWREVAAPARVACPWRPTACWTAICWLAFRSCRGRSRQTWRAPRGWTPERSTALWCCEHSGSAAGGAAGAGAAAGAAPDVCNFQTRQALCSRTLNHRRPVGCAAAATQLIVPVKAGASPRGFAGQG